MRGMASEQRSEAVSLRLGAQSQTHHRHTGGEDDDDLFKADEQRRGEKPSEFHGGLVAAMREHSRAMAAPGAGIPAAYAGSEGSCM